jgi:hypothetical protein
LQDGAVSLVGHEKDVTTVLAVFGPDHRAPADEVDDPRSRRGGGDVGSTLVFVKAFGREDEGEVRSDQRRAAVVARPYPSIQSRSPSETCGKPSV